MDTRYIFLPQPREIEYGNTAYSVSLARTQKSRIAPDVVTRPEGYHLTISNQGVDIVAHDDAGAFYARQTLNQIMQQARRTGYIRELQIRDWPDYPHRGIMLDISRDKVPTMKTLYDLVDTFSSWKINQLQLYTEHTFAYKGHEVVWKEASPMTAQQVRDLDAYCKAHFIELVPNQNSFGHMERWLSHEQYKHLAECEELTDTPWGKRKRRTLCPVCPESLVLIEDLYDQLLPHFTSDQFNVGCDETIELGRCKSKAAAEEKGEGRVYLDFLIEIHQLCRSHGKTMQFWGDIILHHPELIPELPDNITALVWGYEAQHPFDDQCAQFAASDVPFYVCPGTSSWNSLLGRHDNAVGNLRNAAENGLKHGAIGFLNTNWGDHGHWQPWPVSYPAFAYGAAVNWAVEANKDIDIPAVLDAFVFQDSAHRMGRLLCDLANAYQRTNVLLHNRTLPVLLLYDPTVPFSDGPMEQATIPSLSATIHYVDSALARMLRHRMQCNDADLIVREITQAAALFKHGCRIGIARLQAPQQKFENIPASGLTDLADELEPLILKHRALWTVRNRIGGLKDSAARMESVLKRYQAGI